MTPEKIVTGIMAVGLVGCLVSIAMFFLLWLVASVLTVIRARHRARHQPELLTRLARDCTVSDIAEIDDELERVLAQEHGQWSDWVPHAA